MKKISKIAISLVLTLCVFLSVFSVGVSAVETVQVKLPGSDSIVHFELEDGATVGDLKKQVAAYLAEQTGKTFSVVDLSVFANKQNAPDDFQLSDLDGMSLEIRETLPEEKVPDYLERISKGVISRNIVYKIIDILTYLVRIFYGFFNKA